MEFNWTGYMMLFHKEDEAHHTFELQWPHSYGDEPVQALGSHGPVGQN
jgi:hypothetical protein